jgi:fructokinase
MSNKRVQKSPACVVGIGEILWDLLPSGKMLGGAPGNVAAMATQLGAHGVVVSAVGDDPYGREILERMDLKGVDRSGIRTLKELATGVVDVTLDSAGVPAFSIRQPAAWDAISFDDELARVAKSADAVVFGTLAQRDPRSRAGITAFLRATRPDCLKVCDVNFRPPFVSEEVILASLQLADILKLNETELPEVARLLGLAGDETTRLHEIRSRFDLDLVVYTQGPKGSRMVTAHEDVSHPESPATVVDTVGAGDSFVAVVTAGLLMGLDIDRIQDLANRVAAFVCTQAGGTPPLPADLVAEFKK